MEDKFTSKKLKTLLSLSIFMVIFSYSLMFFSLTQPPLVTGITILETYTKGDPPQPVIKGVEGDIIEVFNNQTIHLDASESYDRDGRVVDFVWQIGKETFYGRELDYRINEEIESLDEESFPIIYLSLSVTDDSGNTAMKDTLIKVLPNKLYLSGEEISLRPKYGKDRLRLPLSKEVSMIYELPRAIKVPPCKVKLHIDTGKRISFGIREIKLFASCGEGGKILLAKNTLNILDTGEIELNGMIKREISISGFEIKVRGIPLCSFNINYGNSYIEFLQS